MNSNNSTILQNIDEYTNFLNTLIVEPISKPLFHGFDSYKKDFEDHFFQVLNNHNDLFTRSKLEYFAKLMIVPNIISIILLSIALLTLLVVLPKCCYRTFCKKNKVRPPPSQCVFCFQITFGFLSTIFIILFGIGSLLATIHLDLLVRNSFRTTSNNIENIGDKNLNFEKDLSNVNKSIDSFAASTINLVSDLPETTTRRIIEVIENLGDSKKFFVDVKLKTDFVLRQFENMQHEKNEIINILQTVKRLTTDLQNSIKDENIDYISKNQLNYDISKIRKYATDFLENKKFSRWDELFKILKNCTTKMLPQVLESLDFVKLYPNAIKNNLKKERYTIYKAMNIVKTESRKILKSLIDISRSWFHKDFKNSVKRVVSYGENVLNTLNRNTTLIGNSATTTFIVILPSLASIIYGISVIIIYIGILCETHIYGNTEVKESCSCLVVIPSLKLITTYGVTLLCTSLILCALCYTGALSLFITCYPITTDHFYTKYTDNKQVWFNKTWLDHIIEPWGHDFKLKNITDRCGKNMTVYEAFEVEKYWSISDLFKKSKIYLDEENVSKFILDATKSIHLPDGNISVETKNNFSNIETEIWKISPQVNRDLEFIYTNEIKANIENMIAQFQEGSNSHKKLLELEGILSNIQKLHVDKFFEYLLEIKYMLKLVQKDLVNIIDLQKEVYMTLSSNMSKIIKNHVENTSKLIDLNVKNIQNKLEKRAKYEIGNCFYIADTINTGKHQFCQDMPIILNITWVLLLFCNVVMIINIVLSSYLSNNFVAIQREQMLWLQRMENEKGIIRLQRLNRGTLLFDRSGNFMGDSKTISSQAE